MNKFIQQVRETLVSDLEEGLQQLKEGVKDSSRHYNTILLLMGQFNAMRRDVNMGLVQGDQARTTFARINNAALELLGDLTADDLNRVSQSTAGNPERGTSPSRGVVVEEDTLKPTAPIKVHKPLHVFISYAREDETYKDRLLVSLKPLERMNKIKIWTDRTILPGETWNNEIETQLRDSDLILLLVSDFFLASDYIYSKELPISMELFEQREALIVPVIVRHSNFQNIEFPFSKFQAVPTDAKPIRSFDDEDEAWADVSRKLNHTINYLSQEH